MDYLRKEIRRLEREFHKREIACLDFQDKKERIIVSGDVMDKENQSKVSITVKYTYIISELERRSGEILPEKYKKILLEMDEEQGG